MTDEDCTILLHLGAAEADVVPAKSRPKVPRPPTKKQVALFRAIMADPVWTPAERAERLAWLKATATSKTCGKVIDWLKMERFKRSGVETPRTQEL